MIICDVCHEGAKYQYVKVNGKNVCMDCAVTKTIDEMLDELDLKYEDVPEEIEAEYQVMDEGTGVIEAVYTEVPEENPETMDVASSYPSRMEIPEKLPEDFLMNVDEVVYTPEAAKKLGIEIDENGHSVKN